MKALFVDTAGWVTCVDAADPAHNKSARARDAWLQEGGVLITTDHHFVQAGFVTLPR